MDLGLFTFNTEYTVRADELARESESRGFESLWFPEHTHIPASRRTPYPGGGELPKEYVHMSDPLVGCAAAAAVTERLVVGTAICLVNQHDPIALAKTVASVDRIADGRFEFGVGAMRALWTEREASYQGEFVRFDRVWSEPKPVQRPHPPVVLGTFGSAIGIRRVAQLADGWIPIAMFYDDFPAALQRLRDELRAAGRAEDAAPVSVLLLTASAEDAPDEDELRRYADLPVRRLIVRIPTEGRESVLPFLDRYAEMARKLR